MTYSELIKKLKKAGCYLKEERRGTNHDLYVSPITNQTFTVPRHKTRDVSKGMLHAIEKQSGVKLD